MSEPEDLDELVRALASPHRRSILRLVWARERGAGELAQRLDLAPASVSEHLRVLRKTGLVTVRVDGTYRWYLAQPDRVALLLRLLAEQFPNPDDPNEGRHD